MPSQNLSIWPTMINLLVIKHTNVCLWKIFIYSVFFEDSIHHFKQTKPYLKIINGVANDECIKHSIDIFSNCVAILAERKAVKVVGDWSFNIDYFGKVLIAARCQASERVYNGYYWQFSSWHICSISKSASVFRAIHFFNLILLSTLWTISSDCILC